MDIYRETVLDHYTSPRHQGKLSQPTHQARATNPLCGDQINIQVQVDKDKITDIKHQSQGCVITIASASLLCELASHLTTQQILDLTPDQLLSQLKTPLTATRQQCALVAFHALKKALQSRNETTV